MLKLPVPNGIVKVVYPYIPSVLILIMVWQKP